MIYTKIIKIFKNVYSNIENNLILYKSAFAKKIVSNSSNAVNNIHLIIKIMYFLTYAKIYTSEKKKFA